MLRFSKLILYSVFILSGLTGLVYEAMWSRYLSLFLGHAAYAQIVVLVLFLAGLAVGSFVTGRYTDKIKQPLILYAMSELIIGIIALFFHDLYNLTTQWSYNTIFAVINSHTLIVVIKAILSFVLIFPTTFLLGCTFPLMCSGILQLQKLNSGQEISRLYFFNSIGAAIGVMSVGFLLVPSLGLPGTILLAGFINIFLALLVWSLYFFSIKKLCNPSYESEICSHEEVNSPEHHSTRLSNKTVWVFLVSVSFASAMTSFMYEVGWLRMLSLVLGSATHSFEIMLSAFIFGLALGSLVISRFIDNFSKPLIVVSFVQILMGLCAVLSLILYRYSYDFAIFLNTSLKETIQGYYLYNTAKYILCLIIMLPTTFFTGITLPLIIKVLFKKGFSQASIGYVYGYNTLGSIAGVILSGFILMPLVGVCHVVSIGSTIDIFIGIALGILCLKSGLLSKRILIATTVISLIGITVGITSAPIDPNILASGVYRKLENIDPDWDVLFYKDGKTSSVAVLKSKTNGFITIKTNGKPDASLKQAWFAQNPTVLEKLGSDDSTQTLLGLVPLAHRLDAKEAAVVGQGSGMTGHFLLASPFLKHLTTIEIEPEMVHGSRWFLPANKRVFKDSRACFVYDDAKTFFASHQKQFDIIVSEPSNPWVSGVANIFTTEFYHTVTKSLKPKGVFAQWLHLYENDDYLVLTVLAAMRENFNYFEIFSLGNFDVVILATNENQLPTPDWNVFNLPLVRQDLKHVLPLFAEQMEASRLITSPLTEKIIRHNNVKPNSDYYPYLDLGAEQARFLNTGALVLANLRNYRFDIIAPFLNQKTNFYQNLSDPVSVGRLESLFQGSMIQKAWHDKKFINGASDLSITLGKLNEFENQLTNLPHNIIWEDWISNFVDLEEKLHKGTAGFADQKFYNLAYAYIKKYHPPEGIKTDVDFLYGLATWDFKLASQASDALHKDFKTYGSTFIPDVTLRDGAVIAKIMTGDYTKARHYLIDLSANIPVDYRYFILESFIPQEN